MDLHSSLSPLYLIIWRDACGPCPLEDTLASALDAGVRTVQLREKTLGTEALRRLAETLLDRMTGYGAHLYINTYADIAVEVGARGVHLPAAGPSPGSVRQRFGHRLAIGTSAHDLDELGRAEPEGADFVTYGPVYPPGSKGGSASIVGIEGLRSAVKSTSLPVFALGGITPERVLGCREAGASGIAVVSGILGAEDVGGAVRSYVGAWEQRPIDPG